MGVGQGRLSQVFCYRAGVGLEDLLSLGYSLNNVASPWDVHFYYNLDTIYSKLFIFVSSFIVVIITTCQLYRVIDFNVIFVILAYNILRSNLSQHILLSPTFSYFSLPLFKYFFSQLWRCIFFYHYNIQQNI